MTEAEFSSKYRPVLLGRLAECYATRKMDPSSFGMVVDQQYREIENMLRKMWTDAQPESAKLAAERNGALPTGLATKREPTLGGTP